VFQVGEIVVPTPADYAILKSHEDVVASINRILFYTVGLSMQGFQDVGASNDEMRIRQGYINAYGNIIATLNIMVKPPAEEKNIDLV
jgi:hypothetical protein